MPAPSNDNFASAIALSTTLPGTRTNDTTFDATWETGEPPGLSGGAPDSEQSVWYTFTPTTTGYYRFKLDNISANGSSGFRVVIAIFTGSAVNALTEIRRFSNGLQGETVSEASVLVQLTASTTYRLQVTSPRYNSAPEAANTHTCEFDLHWDLVTVGSAPANDNIASPTSLGTDPPNGTTAGTTVNATAEGWEVTDGYIDPSVWYRFHSTVTGNKEINVVRGSNPNWYPYYEVYRITTDPPADFTDLAFIDAGDKPGGANYFDYAGDTTIALLAGSDYLIYVQPWYNNGEWSDFSLIFGPYTPPAPPANDSWAATYASSGYAYNLNMGKYPIGGTLNYTDSWAIARDGTTVMATAEVGEAARAGFAATRSVWYYMDPDFTDTATWTLTVDSAVDCVLGVYDITGGSTLGSILLQDDDSGPGNNPLVTFVPADLIDLATGNGYAVVVDSKTEGTFTLKLSRQPHVSPPSNGTFATAEVHSGGVWSASGTTVNANPEFFEPNAQWLGAGPKDSVWYKWTPNFTGTAKVWCRCTSNIFDAYVYVDVWQGSALATLTRVPEPPRDSPWGFFNHFDTDAFLRERCAVRFNVTSGQDYYIRVQTESGGSETFDIQTEVDATYLKLTPSGVDYGPYSDAQTVYLDLQALGSDEVHGTIFDANTVRLTFTPITTYEQPGKLYLDTGSVYLDIGIHGGECFSTYSGLLLGEGDAETRWSYGTDNTRWNTASVLTRWSEGEVLIEGINC